MIRPVQKIRPMTKEERQRAKEKEKANTGKCVSCGAPTHNEWCDFCLRNFRACQALRRLYTGALYSSMQALH